MGFRKHKRAKAVRRPQSIKSPRKIGGDFIQMRHLKSSNTFLKNRLIGKKTNLDKVSSPFGPIDVDGP